MRYTVPVVTDNTPDIGSFEELAMPHFAKLYNFAYWLTQNRATAEDLVQEAYMKALKGFSTYQQGTNFRAWIYRILRHTFLTTQTGIRASASISYQTEVDSLDVEAYGTPESILLAQVDQERIQEALEDLPLNFREVLLLCDLEEMTYKDISQTLGLPIGTVMSRLSRARSSMRVLLTAPRRVREAPAPVAPTPAAPMYGEFSSSASSSVPASSVVSGPVATPQFQADAGPVSTEPIRIKSEIDDVPDLPDHTQPIRIRSEIDDVPNVPDQKEPTREPVREPVREPSKDPIREPIRIKSEIDDVPDMPENWEDIPDMPQRHVIDDVPHSPAYHDVRLKFEDEDERPLE